MSDTDKKKTASDFRDPFYGIADSLHEMMHEANNQQDADLLRLIWEMQNTKEAIRKHLNANYRWD